MYNFHVKKGEQIYILKLEKRVVVFLQTNSVSFSLNPQQSLFAVVILILTLSNSLIVKLLPNQSENSVLNSHQV